MEGNRPGPRCASCSQAADVLLQSTYLCASCALEQPETLAPPNLKTMGRSFVVAVVRRLRRDPAKSGSLSPGNGRSCGLTMYRRAGQQRRLTRRGETPAPARHGRALRREVSCHSQLRGR